MPINKYRTPAPRPVLKAIYRNLQRLICARMKTARIRTAMTNGICDYIIEVVIRTEDVAFVRVYQNARIAEGVITDKQIGPIGAVVTRPTFVAV